jgi:hypothetical protein
MDYALEIPYHNAQQHIDLEKEIQLKKNGLLTFTVRVAGGKIVDLSLLEYVARKRFEETTITQLSITRSSGAGNKDDALRGDDH